MENELRAVVDLAQIEIHGRKATFSWPFATCTAIGDHTLLASAREVMLLAAWHRQGSTIWVTCPASGNRQEVKDFHVRREFAASAHLPGDWFYANLGLLVVEGRLPKTARLASIGELREIEDGLPIACFGISHDGGKITRFTRFEPQCHRGEVYRIGGSDGLPENLRLLELKARIPENVFGSPIVNRQGDVIAVYGEAAPLEKTGVKDLHYATVLDPGLLQSWIKGDKSGWVPPPEPTINGGTQDDPQTPRSPVP